MVTLVYPYRHQYVYYHCRHWYGYQTVHNNRNFYYHHFINTGTKQCTSIRFARYPAATAKACFSQWCVFMHICIYMLHTWIVALPNPGTYGTRKYRSWRPDIHRFKDPEGENPKIQKSKKLKTQKSKNPTIPKKERFRRCEKFWIFGFLGFTVVFPICRNRSKIGFGKRQRLCRYLHCF